MLGGHVLVPLCASLSPLRCGCVRVNPLLSQFSSRAWPWLEPRSWGRRPSGAPPPAQCTMGNANEKKPTPPPGGITQKLREDVTCSICLDVLEDPVSIDCGHNFCRSCLSAHWSGVSAWGLRCPECRAPCSRDRMTPDVRLRSLVEKIRDLPCKETLTAPQTASTQAPGAVAEPGRPVQLVRLDEAGDLTLDEEALSRCLEQGGVGDAPVCLVSVIGEQRMGKSFLLNYLLRRLRSLDVKDDGSWMGREEEPLEGFEWRVGTCSVTKGVWAWSQPFWVCAEGRQVAVLLVDTEGSMDIARDTETSVKLSALSMLLGSYQILNVSRQLKDPDLEYLEMFLQVAEEVGKEYGLQPLRHLDLLVRDWSSSQLLGVDGGKEHLADVRQMLEATSPCKHPKALEVLSRSSSRCYLLPFPGRRIMTGRGGALRDMDEDFRQSLRDYVIAVVGLAGDRVWRSRDGELVTGTQLVAGIKKFLYLIKKHRSGFSSPCQMAITFHNERVIDRARADHALFLREKVGDSQNMFKCLGVRPGKMAERLAERRKLLLGRCREHTQGPAADTEALLTELEEQMRREDEQFLETYGKCFKKFAILAGVGVGGLLLAPVGAAAGAGISATAIAAEAAVVLGVAEAAAIGVGAGAAAGVVAGAGAGLGVGRRIVREDTEKARAAGGAGQEGDDIGDVPDDRPLI
ncbi:RING finger protein 112-like isoform X2 [Carettochelys insculpta]|uniref:RING finger protein 112-like isoform X2 n=1 Tax=Carettochelys insculpta TaxID=44489 RepID=UPI003EB829AF